VNSDDIHLFRNAIGPVKRIKQDRVLPARPKPRPLPLKTWAEQRQVLADMLDGTIDPAELETGDELIYRQPGIRQKVFKKLRGGGFSVEAQIDLHGMTVPVAKQALNRFLLECRHLQRRCVRVIHGKGLGSMEGRPVIKNKVNRWLQQRKDVLAFCSARPIDGGTGAVYVLLGR
jgi:DNA-nicking Smr family endonuclease